MTEVTPYELRATTVHDHEFEPVGEWWSLCKHCRLARASHSRPGPPVGPGAPPPPDTPDPPTDRNEPGPEEEELPVGTGTEINMLDAQMFLTTKQEEEES